MMRALYFVARRYLEEMDCGLCGWRVAFLECGSARRAGQQDDSGTRRNGTDGNRRVHEIRIVISGGRKLSDSLRGYGDDSRRKILLQPDTEGQRGYRRGGLRRDGRRVAAI